MLKFKKSVSRVLIVAFLMSFLVFAPQVMPIQVVNAAAGGNCLNPSESLTKGQSIHSPNNQFTFDYQTDGNVVLYWNGTALWNAGTQGQASNILTMQDDGNLVLYNGSTAVWNTVTGGRGPSTLVVQDDGNVVVYVNSTGAASWNTVTGGHSTDTTAPTVSLTAPANGATVSGTVNITASADDNVGVTKVEFFIDGTLMNTDTSAPYSYSIATTSVNNGSHAIYAKAYDAAGNTTTSSSITVTVNNAVQIPAGSMIYNARTGADFGALSDAYAMSMDGDTLYCQGITLDGRLNGTITKTIYIKGGYNNEFTAVTGTTVFAGAQTITGGTNLVITNVSFQPNTAVPAAPYFSIFDDNYAYTFDGAIEDMFAVPAANGGSPYPVIVVNPTYLPAAKTYTDSPFWWNRYLSTWKNGQHASDLLPYTLKQPGTTVEGPKDLYCKFGSTGYYSLSDGRGPGAYCSPTTYPGYPFYTQRDAIPQIYKFGGSVARYYYANHIRVAWGVDAYRPGYYQWLPYFPHNVGSSAPANYNSSAAILGSPPMPGVDLAFYVQLKKKTVLAAENSTYYEVSYWDRVYGGEVRKDGWAILPKTEDLFAVANWLFFMPKGEQIKLGIAGQVDYTIGSPAEIIELPIHSGIKEEIEALNFNDSSSIDYQERQDAYGGNQAEDDAKNGTIVYIDKYGRDWQCASREGAVALAEAFGGNTILFMNGSANSFIGAIDGGRQIARENNQGVLLTYMSQPVVNGGGIAYGQSYYNNLNAVAKENFRLLAQDVDYMSTEYPGKTWSAVSHSWSGHLVGEVLGNMSGGSKGRMSAYYAINPAHGSFASANISWVNYLNSTSDNVQIRAGYNDPISQNGQGVAFYKYLPNYGNLMAGSSGVYNADSNRYNISQVVVNSAGHTLKSMAANGGLDNLGQ